MQKKRFEIELDGKVVAVRETYAAAMKYAAIDAPGAQVFLAGIPSKLNRFIRTSPPDKKTVENAIALRRRGLTWPEIANRLGVNRTVLMTRIKQNGYDLGALGLEKILRKKAGFVDIPESV